MTETDLELLHEYFDGCLAAERFPSLQTLLRQSVEARRMLRDLATVETKLRELAAPSPAILAFPSDLERESAQPLRHRLRWRPMIAVAACAALLLIGVLFTSHPPSRLTRDSGAAFASAQDAITRMPAPALSPMPEWISPTASMLKPPGFPQ